MLLRILLTAHTPLSFRTGRNPARSDTLSYVPGTNLLGGLAQAHQVLGRDPEEFAAFFLQDKVRFGNCYPASFRAKDLESEAEQPVLPMPLTARSCKRFGGFKYNATNEEERREGVTDALIPLALFALSEETRPDLLTKLDRHPVTGHRLDTIDGFFRGGSRAEQIGQPQKSKAVRIHTGVNYQTGTVQSAVLYSRQILPEERAFWGRWWIDDTLWKSFEGFIDEVMETESLRLGNNRTRGLGQVGFNAISMEAETVAALRTRVENFSTLFKAEAAQANVDAPAALYVPIMCTSDVILYDALLRARLQLCSDDLAAVWLQDSALVFHAASTVHVQSWSTVWGLPKADDWAIGMGSVFLFALSQANDDTFTALWCLAQQGLGSRRAEGFGTVSVAHTFHTDLAGGEFR
jgi:CRISPR-associated Csx10 family RAMP protein